MHQIWTSETKSHDLMQLFPPLKPVRWFLMHQMCTFELKSPHLMQLFPFFDSGSSHRAYQETAFQKKSRFQTQKRPAIIIAERLP